MPSEDTRNKFLVIGAGLPRTGTNSLMVALDQIVGPTHHMQKYVQSKGSYEMNFFNKAMKRRVNAEVHIRDNFQAPKFH